MKDIYELLNEIDVEEDDMVEMEVTDIEKQKVKTNLKMGIKRKGIFKRHRLAATVATICITVLGTTIAVTTIDPTYASDIPIVRDIFKFLDSGKEGIYNKFKENSNEINIAKKDSGVEIKITDAVFDGFTIYYTYEIKTDEDLGEELIMMVEDLNIRGYDMGQHGRSEIKRIAPKTYVGQSSRTLNGIDVKNIDCKLKFKDIYYRQSIGEGDFEVATGSWTFKFDLESIQANRQIVNKSTFKNGIRLNIESITNTAMSSTIIYNLEIVDKSDTKFIENITNSSGWLKGSVELKAVDDCNNVYEESSTGGGHGEKGIMTYIQTFSRIDENANKFIITPRMVFGSKGGEVSIDENNNEVYSEYTDKIDDIVFDDIEIILNR